MKKYSVFISSHYGSLTKERNKLITMLLDSRLLPIGMEHFTITANEDFEPLKKLIDQSDIFIMLLGAEYGSCDEKGISWTQREYEYANRDKLPYENQNKCYVIKTKEYIKLCEKDKSLLTEAEQKLLRFGEQQGMMAQVVTETRTIETIISQIITDIYQGNADNLEGWTRRTPEEKYELFEWQNANRAFDLKGSWYHVLFRNDGTNYIRIGKTKIEQEFNKNNYNKLIFDAKNYNILNYNSNTGALNLDPTRITIWKGNFHLNSGGNIIGAYKAERRFKETYGDWVVEKGNYAGIQELSIVDTDEDGDHSDLTTLITGTFNDVKPSPKMGDIIFFREKKDRDMYVISKFKNVLKEE